VGHIASQQLADQFDAMKDEIKRLKKSVEDWHDRAMLAELREEKIRAENEALKEWRPIDTAPQDGSLLLVGWWRTWPEVKWECEVNAAGNLDTGQPGTCWAHGQATHWLPLPAPPALRGKD
jgi:hypothetical protein